MERKISDYINSLNQEKKPKEHNFNRAKDMEEYEELVNTVKIVRQLKEYKDPSADFEEKLLKIISNNNKKRNDFVRKLVSYGSMAAILAIILISVSLFNMKKDIVQAIESSYKEINAYHGIMTITSVNESGEEYVQGKKEVWADQLGNYVTQELEGTFVREITVNNGEKKWQVNTAEKSVDIYAAFPDISRFTFEIGNEIQNTKNALEIEEVGEEKIHERLAIKLAVTPEGGETYHLWIDKETNLPIQRETAMNNSLQYLVTYETFEALESIPEELLIYALPEGYVEVDKSLELRVTDLEEAKEILGFEPINVEYIPTSMTLQHMTVDPSNKIFRLYYKINGSSLEEGNHLILLQKEASPFYDKTATSILGTVNGHPAEYNSSIKDSGNFISYATSYGDTSDIGMIRWQENGYEFALISDVHLDTLMYLGTKLLNEEVLFVVNDDKENEFYPEVKVDINLEIEENTQKAVDGGSSPWKLDPAYVSSVEASLLMSTDGIVGENPIEYEDVKIVYNDGTKAIAEINKKDSAAQRIYLKKLIRQDETGIWTMVGYDGK